MNNLQQINTIAQRYLNGQVIFDEPLKVKSTPHQHVFTVYGVWSGDNGLFVLDGAGEWHGPLLENQLNGEIIINSIYQRMKLMPPPVSVVVAQYDADVNATIFE